MSAGKTTRAVVAQVLEKLGRSTATQIRDNCELGLSLVYHALGGMANDGQVKKLPIPGTARGAYWELATAEECESIKALLAQGDDYAGATVPGARVVSLTDSRHNARGINPASAYSSKCMGI
ncbi:hypothetical protein [Chitinimonas naiadis]